MTPAQWEAARRLFEEALAQPEAERGAFVEERSADDAEVRAEVLSLLGALDRAGGFLSGGALGPLVAEPEPSEPEGARIGARIGAWRVTGLLGRGGMGIVYLGERAGSEFTQRVAIKVVSGTVAGSQIARRFHEERRILASLEHPGIARLIDGGTTDDGLPYFVMEHVEGRPLVAYAEEERLDVGARLRLFLEICAAVDAAHQRLVIHRDIKPGNILVGADGRPKLLDFGLAKIVDPDGADEAAATVTLGRWMTPAYASPEQVRGEPTGTASDVYSLGVVLFELLVGAPPFSARGKSAAAFERELLEQDPPRPSTAALRNAEMAGASGVEWTRRARELRGDLDTIVLKAMAKEVERRYRTVGELARDLDRLLAGRPVSARPDTVAYRTAKFLRRHRLGAALAAVALVALVGGAAAAIVGSVRARRAEAVARAEAKTAERVSEFLVELFKVSDPGESRGSAVTARELLDRGAERIDTQLADDPAVRARLLAVIARAYGALGLYDPALATLESQAAAESALHGAESVETARVWTRMSEMQMRRAAYTEMRDLALRALAVQEPALGPAHLDLASTLSQLGLAHWQLGDLPSARTALERSLAMRESLLGAEHVDLGGILNNVANLRWQMGELAAARPLYERALAIFEGAHGERHPSVASTLNNLAILHLQEGDADGACALHERALAVRRALLAPDHPDVAESLNNLGDALRAAKRPAEASSAFDQALAIREKTLGPDHPYVATTLYNRGLVREDAGEIALARADFERALAGFTKALGADHFHVSYPLASLGGLERRAGNRAAAEVALRRALDLREKALGPTHPDVVPLRRELEALVGAPERHHEAVRQEKP